MRWLAALLVPPSLLLASCGSGLSCEPGTSTSCTCPSGLPGAQLCDAFGTGIDTCACGPWSKVLDPSERPELNLTKPLAVLPDGGVVISYDTHQAPAAATRWLRRYDANGKLVYERAVYDQVVQIAADEVGHVYVLATVPGGPSPLGDAPACKGESCAAIGRLDESGSFSLLELFDAGPEGKVSPTWFAVAGGRITVSALFTGSLDIGTGAVSTGKSSYVVAQIDSDGTPRWLHDIASTTDTAHLIQGYVAVAANKAGEAAFLAPIHGGHLLVGGLDAQGEASFTNVLNDTYALSIAHIVMPDSGHPVIAYKDFGAPVDPYEPPPPQTSMLMGIDAAGEKAWVADLGPTDMSPFDLRDLQLGPDDQVWLAGQWTKSTRFAGAPLPTVSSADGFLLIFDESGAPLTFRHYGGPGGVGFLSLGFSTFREPVVLGAFDGTIDFGQGPLVASLSSNLFVAKLAP